MKINPDTLEKRITRAEKREIGTNVPSDENPPQPGDEPGCTGCKIDPSEIVEKIDSIVAKKKVSIRDAADIVAKELEKKPSAIRSAYCREKERTQYVCTATEAMQFAEMAIFQLKRIRKDDPKRSEAFATVIGWINTQEDK